MKVGLKGSQRAGAGLCFVDFQEIFTGLIVLLSLYFEEDINYFQVSSIFMNPRKAIRSQELL